MQLSKFKPWDWFKTEQERGNSMQTVNNSGSQLAPFMQLHSDIDRLVEQMFRDFRMPMGLENSMLNTAPSMFKPSLDIQTKSNEYNILVEVPGVDEKDVELELIDNTLTIKGKKEHSQSQEEADNYIVERSFGSFQRVVSLPNDTDKDNIEATFKNGVLNIKLPRLKTSEVSKAKVIDIKTAA